MRIVSVNLAQRRSFTVDGREVFTGIFKEPADQPAELTELGFTEDFIADPRYHGGPDKAVYAYGAQHYDYWRRRYPGLSYGMFGENLTVEGLDEHGVRVGDRFELNGILLRAVQPRVPCMKLGLKFGSQAFLKMFLEAGRSGIYFAVEGSGRIAAGDSMTLSQPSGAEVTLAQHFTLWDGRGDPRTLRAIANCAYVLPKYRKRALEHLSRTA
ncbi:MAG: MOSC domain-containing protein [Acidobacteria bacterium]|nr:MOSC domain-containing protein [Acidobacteriota bacterium]